MKKKIPEFTTIKEASEFWQTHDFTDFADDTKEAMIKFVRPRKTQVTFRLDADDVEKIKKVAERKGLSYTTLIRMWVKERLAS